MRRYFVCCYNPWNKQEPPIPIYLLETAEELTLKEFKRLAEDIFPPPTTWGWVNVSFYTEEELEEEVKDYIRKALNRFIDWETEEDLEFQTDWEYQEWLNNALKGIEIIARMDEDGEITMIYKKEEEEEEE